MRTVSQIIKMYQDIFKGKTVFSNGYTLTSDGIYWMVDGNRVDTIEDKKKHLTKLLEKASLASKIATYIGGIDDNILDEYYMIYDVCGDMTLFFKNDESTLTFIYIVSSYIAVSQIDKCFGTMRYDKFWMEHREWSHGSIEGTLSAKSQEMIAKKLSDENISITQNFFYDMYFEGMDSYIDIDNAIMSNGKIDRLNGENDFKL